jgi:single-strand DNA-binding protein
MNKVFLIGRLVDAPEHKTTPAGVSVANFRIGVNRRFNRDQSDFFTIVAWRGLADNCAKYLVKGQQVAVSGELQTRSYEGKDGVRRYITEVSADDIEFLAKPGAAGGSNYAPEQPKTKVAPMSDEMFSEEMGDVLMEDEDLPF